MHNQIRLLTLVVVCIIHAKEEERQPVVRYSARDLLRLRARQSMPPEPIALRTRSLLPIQPTEQIN